MSHSTIWLQNPLPRGKKTHKKIKGLVFVDMLKNDVGKKKSGWAIQTSFNSDNTLCVLGTGPLRVQVAHFKSGVLYKVTWSSLPFLSGRDMPYKTAWQQQVTSLVHLTSTIRYESQHF